MNSKLRTLKNNVSKTLNAHRVLFASTIGGLILTLFVHSFEMNLFEAYLYDLRVRLSKNLPAEDQHTVLVTIDDESAEALDEYIPLTMKTQNRLIEKIAEGQPKALAYFLDFNDALTSNAQQIEKTQLKDADQFVKEAETLISKGTPVWLGTDIDITGEVLPPYPLSKLPHRAAFIHKDGTNFSEDKVTRRAVFSIYDEPVLHVELASLMTGKLDAEAYQGVYYVPEVEAKYFLIHYAGDTKDPQKIFKEVRASDLLNGNVSSSVLKDKIVLVGTKTKNNSSDYVYTPFSRAIFTNSKLVIYANIIETLINNNAITNTHRSLNFILTFLLTTLVIAMVFKTSPERGVITTILGSIALLVVGVLFFRYFNVWIKLAHPLVGVSGAYYIFVPYRLIMEYKKRWDIQKKHEVLVQIEELKSNFMSLITHDLKTPVARIQGMAEILSRSGAESVVVSEILNSTDELNRFITSILELATIESNRVKISKQNKDVNKIIEDCVRKSLFQADQKHIHFDLGLEPLFPISIDVPLITKVVSNLIDNAVKYSPENTKIIITSKESEFMKDFIEIKIHDQGYGISKKDLENLFQKFYRVKNDHTMINKGTGLGLYLSRYFVELHKGSLTVKSEEGKGSTFTILLPMEDHDSIQPSSKTEKFIKKITRFRSKNEVNQSGGNYV